MTSHLSAAKIYVQVIKTLFSRLHKLFAIVERRLYSSNASYQVWRGLSVIYTVYLCD